MNVLSVRLPLLRERRDDILLLAEHFIHGFSVRYRQPIKSLHSASVEWMMRHDWPGNIRELENLLHRAFLLTDGPVISVPDVGVDTKPLPGHSDSSTFAAEVGFTVAKAQVVASFERSYLEWLMAETKGNITAAARRSRKERSALRRLLKKHGIAKRAG